MNKDKDNYNRLFVARTRQAREYPGMKRAEVAMMLGIKEEAYKKYEYRSPLPTYLIGRFCVLVRCNVEWLVTGQGRRYTPKQGTNSV
ncbi:MAG: helix-turn-helix transcriptional regulator [Alphaproteobacteria bacterium]|nr:helix-turn-helix transcriptional regulator [Alphaproteobacteria bacterium]